MGAYVGVVRGASVAVMLVCVCVFGGGGVGKGVIAVTQKTLWDIPNWIDVKG